MNESDLINFAKQQKKSLNEVQFQQIDNIDNSCSGLDFCILNAGSNHPLRELKSMILKHGGNVVQNPGPKTYLCIANNDRSLRVKGIIEKKQFNIATVDWLVDSFGTNKSFKKPPKLNPLEMIFATNELKQEFNNDFDPYGDSYTKIYSTASLISFLNKMPIDSLPVFTSNELNELENEISSTEFPSKMFRLMTAYFQPLKTMKEDALYYEYELSKLVFKMNAGKIVNSVNEIHRVTHIFVNENHFNRNELINVDDVKIISFQWILCCHKRREFINETEYLIK